MDCPTVRIKATTGSYPFTTINASDFDPAKHERYVDGDTQTGIIPVWNAITQYADGDVVLYNGEQITIGKYHEIGVPPGLPTTKRGRK